MAVVESVAGNASILLRRFYNMLLANADLSYLISNARFATQTNRRAVMGPMNCRAAVMMN